MSGGAFQISREIFDNPIWQDIPKFRIFFFIVGNAVFSRDGVRVGNLTINRGQYLRSYRNLRDDLEFVENRAVKKYSLSVIKRKVDQLVKEDRLKIEDTEHGTLFTVVNYDLYQGFERYKNKEHGTALEQGWNTDGTGMEQGWNNNNNVKNVNKEKNEIPNINIRGLSEIEKNQALIKKWNEERFPAITPLLHEQIFDWVDSFEEGHAVVYEAMKICIYDNAKTFKYLNAILKDWHAKGVQTKLDAQNKADEFEKEKQKRKEQRQKQQGGGRTYNNRANTRTDKKPKWMVEQEEQAAKQQEPDEPTKQDDPKTDNGEISEQEEKWLEDYIKNL